MTRLEALLALYANVKNGKPLVDWPRLIEFHTDLAWKATQGSVDAAIALIAATLPGWGWDVSNDGEARLWPSNGYALTLADDDPILGGITETADHPATALLLACIAAHIAIEEGKGMTAKTEIMWMIAAKAPRHEWLMHWTAGRTRKAARSAFVDAFCDREVGLEIFKRRMKHGTIRYAKVALSEVPE